MRQEKQDRKNNTYYNNMIMYINNKNGDNDSTMSAMKVSVSNRNTNSINVCIVQYLEPIITDM